MRHTRTPLTEAPLVTPNRPRLNPSALLCPDCSSRLVVLRRCPQGCFSHPRHTSISENPCLHPWFQLAPCSSSLAQYQSIGIGWCLWSGSDSVNGPPLRCFSWCPSSQRPTLLSPPLLEKMVSTGGPHLACIQCPNGDRSAGLRPGTPCPSAGRRPTLRDPSAGQCWPTAGHSMPQCRPVPAFGRHSVPPVPPVPPMQASAGLRPGTPWPQCRPSGLRPALRAPSAYQRRPCFRVPTAPSHRVHVQASAALPLPA